MHFKVVPYLSDLIIHYTSK